MGTLAFLGTADPSFGAGSELIVVASAIIGGTSLSRAHYKGHCNRINRSISSDKTDLAWTESDKNVYSGHAKTKDQLLTQISSPFVIRPDEKVLSHF